MSPPAYMPVPLSPIDEEKAMLSSSYDATDKEALLPAQHATEQNGCPLRKRWARGMCVALRLTSLVVLIVVAQQYFVQHNRQHHLHRQHGQHFAAADKPSWLPHWGGENKGPKHGPLHQHPHRPHGPHGPHMGRPHAIECFDVTAKDAAVNISLALHDVAQPIFLTPGLAESSDISIVRTGKDDAVMAPPPHMPPHMPCPPGRPTTIMIELEREAAKLTSFSSAPLLTGLLDVDAEKSKKDAVFFCSLRMPMGQRGLGLFKHDISKAPEHKPKEPHQNITAIDADKHKKPEHKPHGPKMDFPHVALKINVPAGQPFTLTSNPPPPPPPMRKPWFHWGKPHVPAGPWPHPHPPHHDDEQKVKSNLASTPVATIAHKGKQEKSRHIVIVTITRFFSRVRKAGCHGRAFVRKAMGRH